MLACVFEREREMEMGEEVQQIVPKGRRVWGCLADAGEEARGGVGERRITSGWLQT